MKESHEDKKHEKLKIMKEEKAKRGETKHNTLDMRHSEEEKNKQKLMNK